jgi:RNA polymerase sigma-70 factor (ECF subfamily)
VNVPIGEGSERPANDEPVAVDQRSEAEQALDHVAGLRRYAYILVGDPTDAEDLVQECLLRVIAQTRSWRPVRDLRAYLFTTLHNLFSDGPRRRKARSNEVPIETVIADLVTPARQTKWLEVSDLIAALRELPLEQRQAILLVGLEGMSYAEAAGSLGVPVGTVMSRLSRGRELLRRLTTHGVAGKLKVVR